MTETPTLPQDLIILDNLVTALSSIKKALGYRTNVQTVALHAKDWESVQSESALPFIGIMPQKMIPTYRQAFVQTIDWGMYLAGHLRALSGRDAYIKISHLRDDIRRCLGVHHSLFKSCTHVKIGEIESDEGDPDLDGGSLIMQITIRYELITNEGS